VARGRQTGGRPPRVVDPALLDYATPGQAKYLQAVIDHGSVSAGARAIGAQKGSILYALKTVERVAAAKGYAPAFDMVRPVPEPFRVRGVSTYYNKDGKASGQWVKSALDNEQWEAIKRAALTALAEELPRVKPTPFRGHTADALCTVLTLTDSHVGMLAWGRETLGADWDLKIAEATLVGCFEQMIAAAPAATVGIVSQLGDFLHQDGLAAVTPTSGHNLDSDGRFEKIVEVAIRVLRRVIGMALAKHERVIVLLAEGNHDVVSSIWLRALFRAVYENEPRVEVLDSALPYYVYRHGETMLGFHHGHLSKNAQLPLLMAAQFPEVWGLTKKRYVHTGHRHHTDIKEHSGITVHQHPTLAARDAYAARGGWIAERQVTALTYHKVHGQVRSDTVVPEMLA
jgi:hypothetical protein